MISIGTSSGNSQPGTPSGTKNLKKAEAVRVEADAGREQEHEQRQRQRHRDMAGEGEEIREQPEQIAEQDEAEDA